MKNKIYSESDYIRIHENVLKFKETNDEKYFLDIINSFSTFIQRYVNLICYGRYKASDTTIMKFISLYAGTKKISSRIRQGNNSKSGVTLSINTSEVIQETCASLTKEDVEHYIYITFLNMINNYKDTKPSFHTYVLRTFHFNLYRQLDKHMRNPLSKSYMFENYNIKKNDLFNNQIEILSTIEDQSASKEIEYIDSKVSIEMDSKLNDTTKENSNNIYHEDVLDINWVNGYTCSDLFNCLTPMERRILELWSIEKKTDQQIADMFGLYRGTINNRRRKAKEKLEMELKKRRMINED